MRHRVTAAIEPQCELRHLNLAEQAKGDPALRDPRRGYAFNVGSAALNQKLSAERAAIVVAFME